MKRLRAKYYFTMLLGAIWFLTFLFGLTPGPALASYLDFNISAPTTSGSIVFDGNTLTGTGIQVDNVVRMPDGLTLPITSGLLSFQTGNFVSYANDEWKFQGGGYIDITGGILGNPVTTPLMSGTWVDYVYVKRIDVFSFSFFVGLGGYTDTKDEVLTNYFSMPSGQYAGSLNLSFSAVITGYDNGVQRFASTAIGSGDGENHPVPIPGAVWLLGSSLLGILGIRRKALR